jgi:hypothetical protein
MGNLQMTKSLILALMDGYFFFLPAFFLAFFLAAIVAHLRSVAGYGASGISSGAHNMTLTGLVVRNISACWQTLFLVMISKTRGQTPAPDRDCVRSTSRSGSKYQIIYFPLSRVYSPPSRRFEKRNIRFGNQPPALSFTTIRGTWRGFVPGWHVPFSTKYSTSKPAARAASL